MNCPELYLVALDASGAPVPGALLSSTVAGSSSIPKAVYSDAACTVEHPNPLPAGGDGVFPQFFLVDGGYRFALSYPDGAQLRPPRDYVNGASSGGSGASDHKVLASEVDGVPGYLDAKVESSDFISLSVDPVTQKIKAALSSQGIALAGKVSVDGTDEPGYLLAKLMEGNAVTLTPVAGAGGALRIDVDVSSVVDHKVVVDAFDEAPGYLTDKLVDSATIRFLGIVGEDRTVSAELVSEGVVKVDEGDVAGYLVNKLKAGTGVTLSTTTDETGTTLWINSKTNTWKPLRVVSNMLSYTIKDTDSIVVIDNTLADTGGVANGSPYTQLYFPAASAAYLGRSITITGTTNESGSQIAAGQNIMTQNTTIGWAVGQATGAHRGMQMRTFTCRPTMAGAITYNWVDDDLYRNVGDGT